MNWKLIRRVLTVCGVLYVIALVPSSIRPTWSAAPFRKPNQEITIQAGFGDNEGARIRDACRVPTLLRPLMGAARRVRVTTINQDGKSVDVHDFDC